MQVPLSYWDFGLWLAINAIILLVTSGILSCSRKMFMIEKERLRIVAVIAGIVFMVAVAMKAYETWTRLQPL